LVFPVDIWLGTLTLADRNTTLPHPDADTSPNATIEATDFDLTRTHSRNSFLHRRHLTKNSFGKIDTTNSGLYDNTQYADSTQEVRNTTSLDLKPPERGSAVNGASLESGAANGGAENRAEKGYTNGERKKGVLSKLNLRT
jgi:hypothetical protein